MIKISWYQARRVLFAVAIVLVIIGLFVLIRVGYAYEWTGFGPSTRLVDPKQELVPAKTFWDWLGLLVIPLVLAIGGLWFSRAERRNEQEIAKRRINEDRQIAEDNTQQTTLQAYLEQMSHLLIDKDLRHSEPKSESRAVARAWTLTVLRRLNQDSKGLLLRFLYESDLILKDPDVISLAEANLEGANLEGANLTRANLAEANLVGANLTRAKLGGAKLAEALLWRANLWGANLAEANLAGANLAEALLEKANLEGANLAGAKLGGANLEGANLAEALLEKANLAEAKLGGANLWRAKLGGANLVRTNYSADTKWPKGFDPIAAGAILVEDEQKQ